MSEPELDVGRAWLTDPDPDVRREAVSELRRGGGPAAIGPLIERLGDDDPDVRAAAAEALARVLSDTRETLDLPELEPVLRAIRDEDDENVAAKMVRVLTFSGYLEGVEGSDDPVFRAVTDLLEGGPEPVRSRAAFAAARAGEPGVEPLAGALADDAWRVRASAAQAAGLVGLDRGYVHETGLDPAFEERTLPECGGIVDDRLLDGLRELATDDPDATVRQWAAHSLGRLGDERAADTLLLVLADDEAAVRANAAIALGRIGVERAREPLRAAAVEPDEYRVRQGALRGLFRLDPEGERDLIEERLRADDHRLVRARAIALVRKYGDKRARQVLETAGREDDDGGNRDEARHLAGEIRRENSPVFRAVVEAGVRLLVAVDRVAAKLGLRER